MIVFVVAICAFWAPAAHAGTITLGSDSLAFTASPGEVNKITVNQEILRAAWRVLTPAQREEWKKVLKKTHEQMSDRISKPLLQAIYKETGAGKP